MKIRDAQIEELPLIMKIYNETIPSRMVTADLEPVSVESRIPWFHAHNPQNRPLWVVEAGQVAAWLSFQSFYGRPAYDATAEVSIYVSTAYRGQGIGGKLLTEAIAQAPRLGLKNLLGFIFAHNAPSVHLFDKFSFQTWGHLPGVANLDGVERDLVIMGLHISSSLNTKEKS